jgi:hypothetical protein
MLIDATRREIAEHAQLRVIMHLLSGGFRAGRGGRNGRHCHVCRLHGRKPSGRVEAPVHAVSAGAVAPRQSRFTCPRQLSLRSEAT